VGEGYRDCLFLINRGTHKKLDLTLYELWKGYAPILYYLKVWGCLAKVTLPSHKRSNIGPKMLDVVFVGYAQKSTSYRFMLLSDFSISEYRDAECFEYIFPLKKGVTHVVSNVVSESMNLPASSSSITELVTEPRRSKRQRTETSFRPDFITSFLVKILEKFDIDALIDEFMSLFLLEKDPKTYQEAMGL